MQREADQSKAEKDRALAVYKEYQQNIALSGQLQTDILKGAKAGEDIYSLFLKAVQAISLIFLKAVQAISLIFLKAVQAISLMTSNKLFYSQLEADIRAIYGEGLQQPQPLIAELTAVQGRLTRLREALQREGEPEYSRQRIQSAIKAHEARESQLQEPLRE